ncbi:MAG TPA: hypothetical protein VGQ36_12065 [Thermoanaerobaculia bacterium]|jgi:hypothetical protein|nr:hypothetical protein [Thermoanaerobaculia bacterium]
MTDEPRWKPLNRLITWVVLPFLLVALVAALPAEWIKSRVTELNGPLIARGESDDGEKSMAIVATAPRDTVDDATPLPVTLTLSNRSAETIDHPALLSFDAGEGFEAPVLAALNRQLPPQIPPFGNASLKVALHPNNVLGRYRITTVVRWTTAGESGHLATVLLGPVRVHRGWKADLLGFGAPILSLYKDLALPVVVLLAGFLLQQWLGRLEETRRRTEQERSHVQATWTQMLPTSHRNTSEYYLPALRASGKMKPTYDAWKRTRDPAAAEGAAAECLYYTMLFAREMKEIREKIGGAFLKSHHVEKVVAALWKSVSSELDRVLGLEDMSLVLMRMKRHEAYPSFMQRLRSSKADTPVRRVAERFNAWLLDDYAEILVPCELFTEIFQHELNWPYLHWYEEDDLVYPEREIDSLRGQLRQLLSTKSGGYRAAMKQTDGEELAMRLGAQCAKLREISGLLERYVDRAKKKATVRRISP